MIFCRVKDVSTAMEPPMLPSHHQERLKSYTAQENNVHPRPLPQQRVRKRKFDDGIDDDILNFRRVRIKSLTQSESLCKVYEFRNDDWYDRGTGSCHGRCVDVSIVLILTVVYLQALPIAPTGQSLAHIVHLHRGFHGSKSKLKIR